MEDIRERFRKRVKITGTLRFETAFHIGSGKEGELATDMGVLIDANDRPILPGSTLKGNFRSLAESLAGYLDMTACLLDGSLSGVTSCYTGLTNNRERKDRYEKFKAFKKETEKLEWLESNTCEICKLFGSPVCASRVFFSDGILKSRDASLEIRDGVCIDRDSETARHGAKYDFEVASAGTEFAVAIEMENPEKKELALAGAVIAEWENGFRLGGFTSRGLGRARLIDTAVEHLDYEDPNQLKSWLLNREMTRADNLLRDSLKAALDAKREGKCLKS